MEFFYFKDSVRHRTAGLRRLLRPDDARRGHQPAAGDGTALQQLGIKVEYSHHEVGISQHEIDLRFDDALTMADKVMTYKTVVKEIATRHGVYATFMPKPLMDQNGSGMHTHQSLFTDGKNSFFDADAEHYLSDEAKAFIAGQLRHARELSSSSPST